MLWHLHVIIGLQPYMSLTSCTCCTCCSMYPGRRELDWLRYAKKGSPKKDSLYIGPRMVLHRGPCNCQLQLAAQNLTGLGPACHIASTPRCWWHPSPGYCSTSSYSSILLLYYRGLINQSTHRFNDFLLKICLIRYTKKDFLGGQRYAIAYLSTCSRRAWL